MRRGGFTLIELMVSLLVSLVVAVGLFTMYTNTYESRDFVVGQGTVETGARTPIDVMVDHLRNAQQRQTGSGTGVMDYSVISAASATSVTYYASNSATDTVRYFLDGTDLKRQVGSGTPTVVMANVESLEFRYYKTPLIGGVPSGSYNNDTVVQTTNPNAPTSAEMPFLKQIEVKAKVLIDGFSREMIGLVRLRNSPRKVRL